MIGLTKKKKEEEPVTPEVPKVPEAPKVEEPKNEQLSYSQLKKKGFLSEKGIRHLRV